MKLRDKYGWPIETVKGNHVVNFFRTLFLINLRKTYNKRNDK